MGRLIRTVQTNFTAGELDPLLAMRHDVKHYYNGAQRLRNVFIQPQGGLVRRPGLGYDATLSASGTIAVRFISFEFSTSEHYMIIATDGNLAVYLAGIKQADIIIPHTGAQLPEITWVQSLDTLIVFHPDVQTQKIMRTGSHSSWDITTVPFTNIPSFEFERVTTNTGTPSAITGTTTFTAGGAEFTAADVGNHIRGNGGYAEITAYSTATSVTIKIKKDFIDTTAIPVGEWTIEEPAWSDARGWPGCGTFHQGRLILAGSKGRPQTVWGSKSSAFFNFFQGSGLDDEGFSVTIDADTVNAIFAAYSGRHLQLFTSGGEWYCPIEGEALTPINIMFKRATRRGGKTKDADGTARRLPVVEVDGAVMYVQSGGKAVREFIWVDTEADYTAQNISLLSSHLINDPLDMARRQSTSTEEADYILIVNYDGTLAVLCTLRSQSITAWSLCSTEGKFLAVGVDGDTMYFAVERVINGTTVVYLEHFDKAHFMDASSRATAGLPSSLLLGLSHLEGEAAKVRADDALREDVTVVGGEVALDYDAKTSVEVGLDFPTFDDEGVTQTTPFIRDMPLEPNLQDGTVMGMKKRVVEVYLRLHNTQNIKVNGHVPSFRQFRPVLDAAPPIYTGDKIIEGMLGFDQFGQVEITQNDPGPLNLLGLGKKVAL